MLEYDSLSNRSLNRVRHLESDSHRTACGSRLERRLAMTNHRAISLVNQFTGQGVILTRHQTLEMYGVDDLGIGLNAVALKLGYRAQLRLQRRISGFARLRRFGGLSRLGRFRGLRLSAVSRLGRFCRSSWLRGFGGVRSSRRRARLLFAFRRRRSLRLTGLRSSGLAGRRLRCFLGCLLARRSFFGGRRLFRLFAVNGLSCVVNVLVGGDFYRLTIGVVLAIGGDLCRGQLFKCNSSGNRLIHIIGDGNHDSLFTRRGLRSELDATGTQDAISTGLVHQGGIQTVVLTRNQVSKPHNVLNHSARNNLVAVQTSLSRDRRLKRGRLLRLGRLGRLGRGRGLRRSGRSSWLLRFCWLFWLGRLLRFRRLRRLCRNFT